MILAHPASLRFIHNAENVVFLGPPGVGKTHLALALGYEAVRQGFRVYFANASHLMERLIKAKYENKLEERIKGITKFHLLIVDEMDTCRSTAKVLTASSTSFPGDMRSHLQYLPRTNRTENGEKSSEIM